MNIDDKVKLISAIRPCVLDKILTMEAAQHLVHVACYPDLPVTRLDVRTAYTVATHWSTMDARGNRAIVEHSEITRAMANALDVRCNTVQDAAPVIPPHVPSMPISAPDVQPPDPGEDDLPILADLTPAQRQWLLTQALSGNKIVDDMISRKPALGALGTAYVRDYPRTGGNVFIRKLGASLARYGTLSIPQQRAALNVLLTVLRTRHGGTTEDTTTATDRVS